MRTAIMSKKRTFFDTESRAARLAPDLAIHIPRSHPARPTLGPPRPDSSHTNELSMPAILVSPYVLPILMLLGSNIFMTLAWYGHLRFKEVPLAGVIFAAWGIALVEYCLAVPANRWGNAVYTTAQLKTMQEVITLLVFAGFS